MRWLIFWPRFFYHVRLSSDFGGSTIHPFDSTAEYDSQSKLDCIKAIHLEKEKKAENISWKNPHSSYLRTKGSQDFVTSRKRTISVLLPEIFKLFDALVRQYFFRLLGIAHMNIICPNHKFDVRPPVC